MGKGQDLYEKAKKIIPGGTMLLSKRPEMFLPDYWPTYFRKAKGINVWDLKNRKYIDMIFAVGQSTLGYANKEIDLISIPRVNIVKGLEQNDIIQWHWQINQHGWVNWPDNQHRIFRNKPEIKWVNKKFIRKNKLKVYDIKKMQQKGFTKTLDEIGLNCIIYLIDIKIKKNNKFKAREVEISFPEII